MPLALIIIGLIFIVSAARHTTSDLSDLVRKDFTGPNNFIFWFLSILGIGSLGYIPKLKPVSNAFLVLVIVVLFIHNKGFFARFQEQINSTTTPSTDSPKTDESKSGDSWSLDNIFGNLGNMFELPKLPELPSIIGE